jgi:TatD DNase family protein
LSGLVAEAILRPVPADAHIHFRDLHSRDPEFPSRFAASGWMACAASHDRDEFAWTESLRAQGLVFASSFGIHPQSPIMAHADFLADLATSGRIAIIGEAGFDFFGDVPERVRNPANESQQRLAFEFQLELAERHGLPLLLHVRRAMDLVFEYSRRLARLPAALFHSWPGTSGEGLSLLRRGVPARFSFGSIILNGHKRAIESAALFPSETLLSETDAPWQPPKGRPFSRFEDLGAVIDALAEIRGLDASVMDRILVDNYRLIYGDAGPA